MFQNRTLFILGAGASKEVGLPIGEELKTQIGDKLNIVFETFEQTSGDPKIMETLRQIQRSSNEWDDVNVLRRAGVDIHDSMPQVGSIDDFLNRHRSNKATQICGKLGIAQCILEAEQESLLYYDLHDREGLNLANSAKTWYNALWRLIGEDVLLENLERVFDNISFIVFNYDRCLEQYLYHAIRNTYKASHEVAARLVRGLTIIRPYGSVGNIGWEHGEGTRYGNARADLIPLVDSIKTYCEDVSNDQLAKAIESQVSIASNVVFLGFSFNKQNMALLKAPYGIAKRIYATALNIPKNEQAIIKALIHQIWGAASGTFMIEMEPVSCSQLLKDYARAITST